MNVQGIDLGTFARQWAVEGRRIAWLLGAGASSAAGVPTANHIVVDLLYRLYADAHGLVLQDLNIADPEQRGRVISYYNGANGMPPTGDPHDYSAAFRLALPEDGPRRQYLRGLFATRSASYGQRVLGAFLAQGLTDLVLTTNFDDLIEQAAEHARAALGTSSRSRLATAALGDPGRASLALSDDDFPRLIKLHGDFREQELRNLDTELREQDENLRHAFLDSSRRFGLAVVGYSGRDASVMDMLEEAIRSPGALPAGLWWLTPEPAEALPAVTDLLTTAEAAGIATTFVQIENFDETLAALSRQASLESPLRAEIDGLRLAPRVTDAALPSLDAGELPVLRLNALPIVAAPIRALQASLPEEVDLGGMRDKLRTARWRGAAVASGRHVIALGSASQLTEALALPSPPVEVPLDCLREDASTLDRALGYEALTRALARRLPVRASVRDHGHGLVVRAPNREWPDSEEQAKARTLLGYAYDEPLTGTAPKALGRGPDGQPRVYAEAVRLTIEWRLGMLWLLFVPHTYVSPPQIPIDTVRGQGDPASAWRKERWVNRRNEKWAAILSAWAQLLAPDERTVITVLGPDDRRDIPGGQFVLSKTTAYSRVAR